MKIIKTLATIVLLALAANSINDIINDFKKSNSTPPYIIEDKIEYNNRDNSFRIILLRPVNGKIDECFEVKVGKYTFSTYQLGDTIYNRL